MIEFLAALPATFIPLFVAIDPFLVIPLFVTFTLEMSAQERDVAIKQSVATAFAVSMAFIALGEIIFRLLGITVHDFKIAGGLLLLILSIMEIMNLSKRRGLVAEGSIGVVPLGVPLIVGPAVLTTLLVLVEHYGVVETVVAMVLNLILTWVMLRSSDRILAALGTNGINAMSKIMAILLASIAVMMMRLGLEGVIAAAR